MVRAFYEDFQCAVEDQGEVCEWFNIKTGVKQGCNMSGFLFLIVIDWVMRRTVKKGENGIRWKLTSKLDDLDVADDIALLSSTKQHIQTKTTQMYEEAMRVGLKINIQKTQTMRINARNQERIQINGQDLEEVEQFTYLGATVCKEGGGMKDLRSVKSKRCIHQTEKDLELKQHHKKNQTKTLQDTSDASATVRMRNMENEQRRQQSSRRVSKQMSTKNPAHTLARSCQH